MTEAARITIPVSTDAAKAAKDLNKLDKSLGQNAQSAKGADRAFKALKGVLIGAGIIGAFKMLSSAVSENNRLFAVQEKAERKLAAIVKATGKAAGYSAKEMQAQAAALQKVTTFGDEVVMEGQAIIATFKGIQGEAFQRTTEMALDLSAAFGQDLKSSAIQLGKALEDPTTGLTALKRIGVSFTEAQKAQIKAMQEAGDVAGAQGIILDTLEGQVGGVARAFADSSSGQIAQFSNAFGDLREQMGGFSTSILAGLVPAFTRLINALSNSKVILPGIAAMFKLVAGVIGGFAKAVAFAVEAVEEIGRQVAVKDQAKQIDKLRNSIAAMAAERGKDKTLTATYTRQITKAKIALNKLLITQRKSALLSQEDYLSDVVRNQASFGSQLGTTAQQLAKYNQKIAIMRARLQAIKKAQDGTNVALAQEAAGIRRGIKYWAARAASEKHATGVAIKGGTQNIGLIKQQTALRDKQVAGVKALQLENDKLKASLGGVTKNIDLSVGGLPDLEKAKTTLEDIRRMLADSGDIQQAIRLQNTAFVEQVRLAKGAGLSTVALTRFQGQQKLELIRGFLQQSTQLEGAGIDQRRAALTQQYAEIEKLQTLSQDQRLEAQRVFNEQSDILDQERFASIAAGAQQIAGIANGIIGLGQAVSQYRQAQMKAEISAMEQRGASSEEIAQKERELARKAARDQKKFGIFSTIVDTAVGVTKAFATLPIWAAIPAAILIAAKGAVQTAAISATPLPAAQFGGSFTVPPGNQADSGLLRVNQGETAEVKPVRDSGGGDKGQVIQIGGQDFEGYITDIVNRKFSAGDIQVRRKGAIKTA